MNGNRIQYTQRLVEIQCGQIDKMDIDITGEEALAQVKAIAGDDLAEVCKGLNRIMWKRLTKLAGRGKAIGLAPVRIKPSTIAAPFVY